MNHLIAFIVLLPVDESTEQKEVKRVLGVLLGVVVAGLWSMISSDQTYEDNL